MSEQLITEVKQGSLADVLALATLPNRLGIKVDPNGLTQGWQAEAIHEIVEAPPITDKAERFQRGEALQSTLQSECDALRTEILEKAPTADEKARLQARLDDIDAKWQLCIDDHKNQEAAKTLEEAGMQPQLDQLYELATDMIQGKPVLVESLNVDYGYYDPNKKPTIDEVLRAPQHSTSIQVSKLFRALNDTVPGTSRLVVAINNSRNEREVIAALAHTLQEKGVLRPDDIPGKDFLIKQMNEFTFSERQTKQFFDNNFFAHAQGDLVGTGQLLLYKPSEREATATRNTIGEYKQGIPVFHQGGLSPSAVRALQLSDPVNKHISHVTVQIGTDRNREELLDADTLAHAAGVLYPEDSKHIWLDAINAVDDTAGLMEYAFARGLQNSIQSYVARHEAYANWQEMDSDQYADHNYGKDAGGQEGLDDTPPNSLPRRFVKKLGSLAMYGLGLLTGKANKALQQEVNIWPEDQQIITEIILELDARECAAGGIDGDIYDVGSGTNVYLAQLGAPFLDKNGNIYSGDPVQSNREWQQAYKEGTLSPEHQSIGSKFGEFIYTTAVARLGEISGEVYKGCDERARSKLIVQFADIYRTPKRKYKMILDGFASDSITDTASECTKGIRSKSEALADEDSLCITLGVKDRKKWDAGKNKDGKPIAFPSANMNATKIDRAHAAAGLETRIVEIPASGNALDDYAGMFLTFAWPAKKRSVERFGPARAWIDAFMKNPFTLGGRPKKMQHTRKAPPLARTMGDTLVETFHVSAQPPYRN